MISRNDHKLEYPLEHLDLPTGLTWDVVREAQSIIEDWEERPGASDLDLICSLYELMARGSKPVR